jgi:hypothetical protein
MILHSDPTFNGINTLLCDQYYGLTELSICRVTQYIDQEFHTQATALFSVSADDVACRYQVNGNPKDNPLKLFNG